jgi:hypothetical protein
VAAEVIDVSAGNGRPFEFGEVSIVISRLFLALIAAALCVRCGATSPDQGSSDGPTAEATSEESGRRTSGQGVLERETISTMLEIQPNARNAGLGYGIATSGNEKVLTHSGANPGWFAHFRLSVDRREGFVIANNSSRGGSVNEAIAKMWSRACRDTGE